MIETTLSSNVGLNMKLSNTKEIEVKKEDEILIKKVSLLQDNLLETNLLDKDIKINSNVLSYFSQDTIYRVKTKEELPKIGSSKLLYIVGGEDLYIWNPENKTYVLLNASSANVGDGKITILQNNKKIDSFTVNQQKDSQINIDTPTKVSELDNDKKFISEEASENLDIDFSEYFN